MIQSMTGYGDAERIHLGEHYAVEIRGVNNRYFKAAIKLPEWLQVFEPEVEKLLRTRLGRGSVSFQLKIKSGSATTAGALNLDLLRGYLAQLQQVAQAHPGCTMDLAGLLLLPGVLQPRALDEVQRAEYWPLIQELADEAIARLLAMRSHEGQALAADLLAQCDELRSLTEATRRRAPQVVAEYNQRLRERVDQLLNDAQLQLDQPTLIREVAVFAERCDVHEEITRLASHLDQFAELCAAGGQVGRKLDFLVQEMLREANTIGSKASDLEISRHVVAMKGLIDRLKEQVQNVE